MTRHFFKLGGVVRRKPKGKRRVDHTGKAVLVALSNGHIRLMSQREAVSQIGRSKGGVEAQRRGTAHRFTSEEASKAAKKLWATRYKMNLRINARLGRPAKLAAPVRRPAIRERHALTGPPYPLVGCNVITGKWYVSANEQDVSLIGERTALRKLGYLPYPRKNVVPSKILQPAPDIRRRGRGRAEGSTQWSVNLLPGVRK